MATASANTGKHVRLYYGKKDWFQVICGLNGTGLVPGQTLTEKHISKQDCADVFGDPRANNGYRVSKGSECRDRVVWLWKRVHQVDRPPNSDIGLKFCQGFLYEDRHGQDTVDWAQFAVNTVTWFSNTKGISKVHKDWEYAYPSITIDKETGKHVCEVHPTLPIQNTPRTFRVPTTSSGGEGDAKKRRLEKASLAPNSATRSKAKKTGVKLEYIPEHILTSHPNQKAPQPNQGMSSSQCPPPPEIFDPTLPPAMATEPIQRMPQSGCTATPDIPSPTIETPKASARSKEKPFGCTPSFLKALQLFRFDIERAVNVNIKDLEEKKSRLKIDLDHHRHDVEVAEDTVKALKSELERAKTDLLGDDTDGNRGELKYIQYALKSAENKIHSKKAKFHEVLVQWRHQEQLLAEKSHGRSVLEASFRFQHEEDQPFGY